MPYPSDHPNDICRRVQVHEVPHYTAFSSPPSLPHALAGFIDKPLNYFICFIYGLFNEAVSSCYKASNYRMIDNSEMIRTEAVTARFEVHGYYK
jgi:hypothetical protein